VVEDDELPGFQEWYLFDYPIEPGKTLIDMFAREVGPQLRREERDLLKVWRRWNRFRLFEVQQVMPGTGVLVMDLLSDETLEVVEAHRKQPREGLVLMAGSGIDGRDDVKLREIRRPVVAGGLARRQFQRFRS
jgi:hypothetical protein